MKKTRRRIERMNQELADATAEYDSMLAVKPECLHVDTVTAAAKRFAQETAHEPVWIDDTPVKSEPIMPPPVPAEKFEQFQGVIDLDD